MDQVKQYLRILKKHHFWVLSALTALVAIICWWRGANTLATETRSNEDRVKKSYSDLEGVEKTGHPPNEKFAEGVAAKNEELKNKVMDEWKQQFQSQQKLFAWPEVVAADIAKLKPGATIPQVVRELYKNNAFPGALWDRVFLTADIRRPKSGAAAGGTTEGGDENTPPPVNPDQPPEMTGLVVWSSLHRNQLEQRYNFGRRPGTPTTLNIRLAQEDVWMLENMAKVIRKTNEGAEDVIAVPVKRIDTLDVAQWAINDAVRDTPKVVEEKTEGGAVGGMGRGMSDSGMPAGTDDAAISAEDREKAQDDELLNGRYIGDTGQPLLAADPPPYAEFKLMFVRMKVVIDQRKIPDLLVNCANAEIPIEIVRFRMDEPLIATKGSGAAAPAGGLRGGMGAGDAGRPSGGGLGGGPQANTEKGDEIEPNPSDVTVEICGLVQLFNPPDPAQLGTGGAADPGKRPSGVPAAPVKAPRAPLTGGLGGGLRGN